MLIENKADLIYLGHCSVEGALAGEGPFIQTHAGIVGAHAYLVAVPFLPILLPYLEACIERPAGHPLGGKLHYDGALSLFRSLHPTTRTWLAQPGLVGQRFSRSDVQLRWWYDRWPVVRHLAAWARHLKQAKRKVYS